MRTREIPREAWSQYLATVSGLRAQHPVKVRVDGAEIGDQVLAECLPLVGISLEEKGSEADAIELTVAGPAGYDNLTHLIEHRVGINTRVYARSSNDRRVAARSRLRTEVVLHTNHDDLILERRNCSGRPGRRHRSRPWA